MGQLRERIIQAHGGRERWHAVDRLMVSLSMGGLAFLPHFHLHAPRDLEVSVAPQRGLVTLSPFPDSGRSGCFDGHSIWVEDDDGAVVSSRPVPGASARALRYWSFWDELDRLYVAAVTVWHAVAFPWLLTHPEVTEDSGAVLTLPSVGRVSRLEVTFPAELPVPSPSQTLYADSTGLVRRMDFVPRAYGGWLRVGQILEGLEAVNGLIIPTEQTLYPCLINNQLWRANRFLWLKLTDPIVAYRG